MISERVAIVTGASQGIGAGLVSAYRRAGYRVVANSRKIGSSTDPDVVHVPGDIGDPQTADRIMNASIERFGRVDTLVNNAGIFIAKPFTLYSREDFDSLLSTALAGFFYVSQHAVRAMERQGSGHIVNITATIAEQPHERRSDGFSFLTKGGINAATKALAIEYAARGIRVNAVAPGIIKTPMHPEPAHGALAALHPVGRMGEIADIVSAVMYLEHAGFVTGEIAHVDGGQSAGHW